MKEYTLEIKANSDQFETARLFLIENLRELRVSEQMINENVLIFNKLFLLIIDQYQDNELPISITLRKRFGEVKILIGFSGKRFNVDFHSMEQNNPEAAILSRYEEKIALSFKKRQNTIAIMAKINYDRSGRLCLLAICLAIATYSIMKFQFNDEELDGIFNTFVLPAETMFANATIMVAAPITFFSLLTNITNCYVIADNRVNLRRLGINVLLSSTIAEILAILYYLIFINSLGGEFYSKGEMYSKSSTYLTDIVKDTVYDIVPTDIFQPFINLSPFPMLLISIITAAALCTMNKHFDTLKEIIDAINALFARILSIILLFLPVAIYLAILDVLIDVSYSGLVLVGFIISLCLVGIIFMIIFIGVKVAIFGINPFGFFKKCLPAVRENYMINSSISAVPYNIRLCNNSFGISYNTLNVDMPILAQVNQTANSFMIMFTGLFVLYFTGVEINIVTLILLSLLVTFISIGAPGQGGSIIIGLIIVFSFTGISYTLIAVIIYMEVLLGRTLPVMNSLFDITTVVINDRISRR